MPKTEPLAGSIVYVVDLEAGTQQIRYSVFERRTIQDIYHEIRDVYRRYPKPWIIGYSGGKDSTTVLQLWSLRQVSGRHLPLVIDAPLTRLDDSHRLRFIHDFIPQVSDQVVLLTTDAEMDSRLFGHAEPYLARAYRLHLSR